MRKAYDWDAGIARPLNGSFRISQDGKRLRGIGEKDMAGAVQERATLTSEHQKDGPVVKALP